MSDITIAIPLDEAKKADAADCIIRNNARERIIAKVKAALAAHEREALGLPWDVKYETTGGRQSFRVSCSGIIWPYTEAQARLMAAAPDLAEALEGLIATCDHDECSCGADAEKKAQAALRKSGWV